MDTIKIEDWKKKAVELYGEDEKKWKFKCIKCGHIQTLQDFIDNNVEDAIYKFYFSCIGRYVKSVGCDWTLGGLFTMHKLEVVGENGERSPVFEFADEVTFN